MRPFYLLLLSSLLLLVTSDAVAQRTACEGGVVQPQGTSASFPCSQVDLMANLSLSAMGAGGSNDIWGWTDPEDGTEYALVGLNNGTGFVDVSDPENPSYLGTLPTHTQSSPWRDIKVHANHAYIVSEAFGHGMQVFDLTQLRDVESPPVTFSETAHYGGIGRSHNIVINEETGFAYVVGAREDAGDIQTCSGGLHMVDLSSPAKPTFAGCFADDGYTHDAQCIVYDGPDADYVGQEVCFAFNADTVTLVDVTNKFAPALISTSIYPNVGYTHQGWLTEDRQFLIANDEGDESTFNINTRTLVFDVSNLESPEFRDAYSHPTAAIDHNLYVKGQYVYQSNYHAGLRILDANSLLSGGAGAGLEATAFFDTFPSNDSRGFGGTWSNYPYFESGNIIVNDGLRGLFIVRAQFDGTLDTAESVQPGSFVLGDAYPNPFTSEVQFSLQVGDTQSVRVAVYNVLGRRVTDLFDGVMVADDEHTVRLDGANLPAGTYLIRIVGETFSETHTVSLAR